MKHGEMGGMSHKGSQKDKSDKKNPAAKGTTSMSGSQSTMPKSAGKMPNMNTGKKKK